MTPQDQRDLFARFLVVEYHVLTEEHDRTLPGQWSPHDPESWMPFDMRESIRFARSLLDKLRSVASQAHVLPEFSRAFQAEKLEYGRTGHSRLRAELEEMLRPHERADLRQLIDAVRETK